MPNLSKDNIDKLREHAEHSFDAAEKVIEYGEVDINDSCIKSYQIGFTLLVLTLALVLYFYKI